jgi:hypothetical protein
MGFAVFLKIPIFVSKVVISKSVNMKKIIFPVVCSLLIFFSCSKSASSASGGSITATVNGSNQTFNTSALAISEAASGAYSLAITGFEGAANNSNQVTIGIAGSSPITTGTYTTFGSAADEVSMVYSLPGNIEYAAISNAPQVTITSISTTNVQGTFSGILTLYSGTSSTTTESVTNGKFNVSIK